MLHMLTSVEIAKLKEFVKELTVEGESVEDKLKFLIEQDPNKLKLLIKNVEKYLNR